MRILDCDVLDNVSHRELIGSQIAADTVRVKGIGSCPQDLDAASLDPCPIEAIRAFSFFTELFLGSEKILGSSSRTQARQDQKTPERRVRRVDIG